MHITRGLWICTLMVAVSGVAAARGYQGIGKVALKAGKLVLEDEKGGTYQLLLSDKFRATIQVKRRVWISGRVEGKALTVGDCEVLPAKSKPAVTNGSGKRVKVTLIKVSPYVSAMPGIGGGASPYVIVSLQLKNVTKKTVDVALARAFLSFEAKHWGSTTLGISVRGKNGKPSGQKSIRLPPGATRKVELRGDGLFPPTSSGKTLHVGLVLVDGKDRMPLRKSGKVTLSR